MKPSAYIHLPPDMICRIRRRAMRVAVRCEQRSLSVLAALAAFGALSAVSQESADVFRGSTRLAQTSSKGYESRLSIIPRAPSGPDASQALVVLSSSPDTKVQANLQEDLAVMYHILDKAIDDALGSDQRSRNVLGVDLVFVPDSSHLRSAYFEDYGALFLFRVNSPLLPPATKSGAQKEEKQANSQWEEARQEVFGESSDTVMPPAAAVEPYSEDRVNRLKSSLFEALKNATNVRDLKPEEGVTLCILGGTSVLPMQVWSIGSSPRAKHGDSALLPSQSARTSPRGTILTIRAKKADIDGFAKGRLSLEEFRKNSRITVYEGNAFAAPGFGAYGGAGFGGGYGVLSK